MEGNVLKSIGKIKKNLWKLVGFRGTDRRLGNWLGIREQLGIGKV